MSWSVQPENVSVMLYFRNTSFSRFAAVRLHRLSVKTAPHTEKSLSLDVLVAGTDSSSLAISAILGSCHSCSFQNRRTPGEFQHQQISLQLILSWHFWYWRRHKICQKIWRRWLANTMDTRFGFGSGSVTAKVRFGSGSFWFPALEF